MKIFTVYFDNIINKKEYERVLKIYKYSHDKYMPADNLIIHYADDPLFSEWQEYPNISQWILNNMYKLNFWVDFLLKTEENSVVTDCDMFFTNSIEEVFNSDFDIGYTKRTEWNKKYYDRFYKPINGGVFFFKPTDAAKRFIIKWKETCELMLINKDFYSYWFKKYAGFNQTALGYLIETYKDIIIKEFPCRIYNGCAEDLLDFDNYKPKMVHIKSPLWQIMTDSYTGEKDAIDTDSICVNRYSSVIEYWKELESVGGKL